MDLLDLLCILTQTLLVYSVTLLTHQALATELEQYPFEPSHIVICFVLRM
jgi:hypothetical protein